MMAPVERVEAAGRWLAGVGGVAAPGEVGAAVGVANRSRQADVMRVLRESGWVVGPKSRVELTPAGWARFAGAGAVSAGPVLDTAAGAWPERCYAHRALVRLCVSTVVARWHLHETRPDGHLSFVARGQEGSGKTAVFVMVADLLGVDSLSVVVGPDDETATAVGGRRRSGPDGQVIRQAPRVAGLPLVVFDDVDKWPAANRRAVWPYLSGGARQYSEGQVRTLRPTTAVTYNPRAGQDPDRLLPTGWRRRSVLLDTDGVTAYRGEVRRALETYYRTPAAGRPRLNLAALTPPADRLGQDAADVLETAGRCLADPGAAWPKTGLDLAAVGRLTLTGDGDQTRAAVLTAVDWLTVCSTVPGLVNQDWPSMCGALLSWEAQHGRREVADVLNAYQRGQREHRAAAARRRATRAVEADTLTASRGALSALIGETIATVDGRRTRRWSPARRIEAAGPRDVLVKLRGEVGQAKTAAALENIRQRARPHLEAIHTLCAAVDQDHADAEQAAQRKTLQARANAQYQREEQRQQRQQQNAARHAQRQANAIRQAERKKITAKLNRTSTRNGEDVLAWLTDHHIVTPVQVTTDEQQPAPISRRVTAWATGAPAPADTTRRVTRTTYQDHTGRRHQKHTLTQWQTPTTRAVLTAARDALDHGRYTPPAA